MSFELGESHPWEGEGNDGEEEGNAGEEENDLDDLKLWWDDLLDNDVDRDQVFPDGSHHNGVKLKFTNEDLPNDSNRPNIRLANRRRRNLVYRDVDDMFENILELEDDVKNPKFIDWMINRDFAIRRFLAKVDK